MMREGVGPAVWALLLMAGGLYYGRWFKESAFICCIVALYFIIKYLNHHPFECIIMCMVVLAVVPIPYYFAQKITRDEAELSERNKKLREKYTDALAEHSYAHEERHKFEESMERIMQLYIIGRDLSRNIFIDDYGSTILRALTARTGVLSVNIFEMAKNMWNPMVFSKPYQKNDWMIYMKENPFLMEEDAYSIIPNPPFCSTDEAAIFWPLKLENELLGCIILVVEKEYADRYIEEGAIFGPQISLGTKRVKLFQEVSDRSRNDGLTGLYLKRYFMERLQSEIQREKRYSGGFYILMMDIDFFKNVNDKYGHLTGDKVLCAVAKILVDCSRPGDLVGRYGGEEFIIFMPMATKYEANAVADEINRSVQNKKFRVDDEQFNVTISIGLSNYPNDGSTIEQIVNTADKALYKAKQNGRNQVVLYDKSVKL